MSSTLLDLDAYKCEYYGTGIVPSPSASSVSSMNTDGNIGMFGHSSSSPMSCNMSPMSQISESSSTSGFQNLNISSTSDYINFVVPNNEVYLSIVEEPVNKFRFRYISEMHGTHGSLTGQSTSRTKKSFPTVHLHNFGGEATIRCSLFQIQKFGHEMASPHSHSLVIRSGVEDKKDPHEIVVSPSNGYSAVFQGMGIIHTARKYIEHELLGKLVSRAEFKSNRSLTMLEMEKFKLKAKKEAGDMNLNQVSLCFEAFERRNGEWVELCRPVYSTPINNMKCALTGELKITRLSAVVSSVVGNEDLFLFVEKVGKKNIKVRFYEVDEYENILWEDWGRFSEADVHHQFAIALKTPPYRDMHIEKNVNVFVQLYRPGDESYSDPVPFRYKPSDSYVNNSRKRPRIGSSYSSADIPESVQKLNAFDSDQERSKQGVTISTEFDTQKLIQHVLLSAADSTTTHIAAQNDQFNSFPMFSGSLNSADLVDIFNPLLDIEFDKLATDSVAVKHQPKPVATPLCMSERFLMQMLKKIWPVVVSTNDGNGDEQTKKRDFLHEIFKQAYYNGDSLLHMAMRSDEPRFMDKIWNIISKFELYDLLRLTNDNDETCLHVAVGVEKPNEIRNLLRHGVDINDVDRKGNTALHVAVAENRCNCVETLFQEKMAKIDLGILNDNGYTPLHLAIKNSNLKLVKMIKDKAAASHVKLFEMVETKHGNNALHIAVENGADDIVQFILDNRCVDINATNLSGHTALVLARAIKNVVIVRALMDHNAEVVSEEDEDNTSLASTDSRASVESNKIDFRASVPKSEFDDICLTQLSEIFNTNGKWQNVANRLGYQLHIPSWALKRNPTKIMFLFSEALKLPKDEIVKAFHDLNETAAIRCMDKWRQRNEL